MRASSLQFHGMNYRLAVQTKRYSRLVHNQKPTLAALNDHGKSLDLECPFPARLSVTRQAHPNKYARKLRWLTKTVIDFQLCTFRMKLGKGGTV